MKCAMLAALAGLSFTFGCGNDDPETPLACLGDREAYLIALEDAPAEVRLDGTTPISDCIVDGQSGGELGQVGEALVATATELNRRAQDDPAGEATVQLGYLVGAVQEAASTTGGIHEDLVLRLDAGARLNSGGGALPAEFERAFGQGYAAGQASG
jgi:hypothetical protein